MRRRAGGSGAQPVLGFLALTGDRHGALCCRATLQSAEERGIGCVSNAVSTWVSYLVSIDNSAAAAVRLANSLFDDFGAATPASACG